MSVEQAVKTTEVSANDPEAQVFSLEGTQLLSLGRTDTLVAASSGMTARVKVYAEGGENATHTHLTEDHLFFILQGEATFILGREGEEQKIVPPMSGILIPKGSFYRFQSSGDENLILFRVGTTKGDEDRVDPSGARLAGKSMENNHIVGVPIEGKFFPATS